MIGDFVARGEVDCFGCGVRVLKKEARHARLVRPEGLYCDGVEVSFCNGPQCQQMPNMLDAKYGKPGSAADHPT
jgi:hypothetical protein